MPRVHPERCAEPFLVMALVAQMVPKESSCAQNESRLVGPALLPLLCPGYVRTGAKATYKPATTRMVPIDTRRLALAVLWLEETGMPAALERPRRAVLASDHLAGGRECFGQLR